MLNKSELFKNAWQVASAASLIHGGTSKDFFSTSLKLEWQKLNSGDKKKSMKYDFDFENDTRKGHPYAAFLIWNDEELKIDRNFINLQRDYAKKDVRVYGMIEIKKGQVIEMRRGGSWKNDYRNWYVFNGEKLVDLGDICDVDKRKVKEYLRNEIALSDLAA